MTDSRILKHHHNPFPHPIPQQGTPFASNTRFQELAEYRDHLIEIATQPTIANNSLSDALRAYPSYQQEQQPDPARSRGPKVKPLRPKFSAPPPPSGTAAAASLRRKPPPDPSQPQSTDAAARAAAAARNSKVPRPPPAGHTRAAGAAATAESTPRPAVASKIEFDSLERMLLEVSKVSTETDTLKLEGGGTAQRQVYTMHGTDKAEVVCVRYVFDTDTEAETMPVMAAKDMVYVTCFEAENGEHILRDAVVVSKKWRAALALWRKRFYELKQVEENEAAQVHYDDFFPGFMAEMRACSDRAALGLDKARLAEAHRVCCTPEQLPHRPISEFKRRVNEHVERERLKNVSRAYSPGGHATGV